MSQLKLFLFGPPRLERQGQAIKMRRRKVWSLLAYLAVTQQSHSRDTLATLFWPDHGQSTARANLRRELSGLKKFLGTAQLRIDREQVSLNPEAKLWLDVDQFQHLLAQSQSQPIPDSLSLLSEATALYTADFLAGFTLPDSPAFDEWQFFQTESLRQQLASALGQLVVALSSQGEFEIAIPSARRWLELDPLHELAQRQLMQLYAWAGQQTAALRQYEACVRVLAEELGLPPSEETTELYEAIKEKRTVPLADLDWYPASSTVERASLLATHLNPPAKLDLTTYEQSYRERIKASFAEDAPYYIELTGETTELVTDPSESSAPRSARRRRQRARAEYHEWVQIGPEIKRVKLDSLREGVDKYPCLILLGAPGSGKTTALEHLAYQFADEPDKLPLPLRLSEFESGMSLEAFITRSWGGAAEANHWNAPELAANLEGFLEAGQLFFLFDALNEMPRERYKERAQALRSFIDQWSPAGNRFLVTCRVLDYGEELSGLQRVEVQGLNDDQLQKFLKNELPEDWAVLWQTLAQNEGLLRMARNPYMLTIMIDIYLEDGELGRNRAQLMSRFTQILMKWAKTKHPVEEWLAAEVQQESLAAMAFEMQKRIGPGAMVKTNRVIMVLPETVRPDPNWPRLAAPADQVLKLAASANIIEMAVDRSSVRFYHQLLQEYYAARYMLKQKPESLEAYWSWPWLEEEMPVWVRPENNYEPLPPPPATGWEESTILAAGLKPENDDQLVRALIEINPVLAGRCLHEGQAQVDRANRQAVIEALLATIARSEVALRVRIAAGEVLGYLGDPRVGEMVTIPAGAFWMGSDRHAMDEAGIEWPVLNPRQALEAYFEFHEQTGLELPPYDKRAEMLAKEAQDWRELVDERETPYHKLDLSEYAIGKYPVTNAEFDQFVEAGGYKEKAWWTEAGWKEKEARNWTAAWYRQNPRYNKPNQPVVGLSWFETVAYCTWLSAERGHTYRLPTEAEWEKAARGVDGQLYPWGNILEASRLNAPVGEQQVMTTTPVGIYLDGQSPFGVFDCVGNVWEWCATKAADLKFKPYPYDVEEDEWSPEYLKGIDERVLRGDSWGSSPFYARCAFRYGYSPTYGDDVSGFRLVSPSI